MLLDIYRNRASQTIVSAYSLRGIEGRAGFHAAPMGGVGRVAIAQWI